MFAGEFASPYIDILKLFSKDWSRAELSGDTQQTIDKTIGKKCFTVGGITPASNYLALPKPALSQGLGLESPYLYLQLKLEPSAAFTLHFDIVTDRGFGIRLSLSSRYSTAKRVGTVVQLPCPPSLLRTAGRWTVLALDLPRLVGRLVPADKDGGFQTLKAIVACCTLSLRAAFVSEQVYDPASLPRDLTLPVPNSASFKDVYCWLWLPMPPPNGRTTPVANVASPPHSMAAVTKATEPPKPSGTSASPSTGPAAGQSKYREARDRRLKSGAAPRALFTPPPQPTEPAEPSLLELSRVLGFSGEKLNLLVWLKDGRRVLYASAALIIVQDIDTAAQRFLMGHTADVVALSAAEDTPLVASAQEGPLPIIRLWDRDTCMPLAILQQHASDMHTLSLSHDGALLAAVGKDRKGHQLLAVWDVTQAGAQVPSCPLLDAKVTLSHIKAIQWVPPDPLDAITKAANGDASNEAMQLITCGYENVRFWRLRRGKLHSCGTDLQHEEGCLFLSIALDDPKHGGGGRERQKQRRMLVGGSTGRLFVIDPTTRKLEAVHQLHDEAINAVHLSAGFAVTGGADRKLRVW